MPTELPKWILNFLLNVYVVSAATAERGTCQLPPSLVGRWHQAGAGGPLTLAADGRRFGDKGDCVAQRPHAPQYLFRLSASSGDCYRCVLMFSRHHNVLQYKETQCLPEGDLQTLCQPLQFSDSKLNTLFRASNLSPYACPLSGPAAFAYVDSRRPKCAAAAAKVSRMDRCARDDLMLLRFDACEEEDGRGGERDMQIECIGGWETRKSTKFFAGRIVNLAAGKPADQYRCFIYESSTSGGRLGVSADATCWELRSSPDEAELVIDYTLADGYPSPQCTFDRELAAHRWQSLAAPDHRHTIEGQTWTVGKVDGPADSQSVCIKRDNVGSLHRYTVYRVEQCSRGFYCVEVYKRSNQILEMIWGKAAPSDYMACTDEYFNHIEGSHASFQYETMIAESSVEQSCPHKGRYKLGVPTACGPPTGSAEGSLNVGCHFDADHRIVLTGRRALDDCQEPAGGGQIGGVYNCHGYWEEVTPAGTVHYLVVRNKATGAPACFVYSRTADRHLVNLRSYTHACQRADERPAGVLRYGFAADESTVNVLPVVGEPVNATALHTGKCSDEASSKAALNANENLSSTALSSLRLSSAWLPIFSTISVTMVMR